MSALLPKKNFVTQVDLFILSVGIKKIFLNFRAHEAHLSHLIVRVHLLLKHNTKKNRVIFSDNFEWSAVEILHDSVWNLSPFKLHVY